MPKRQCTTSFLRAALLACTLSAAGGAAHGYWQAQTCFAADHGGSYTPSKAWNPMLGSWIYTFTWNDKWTCSSGEFSMCAMCYWASFGMYTGSNWTSLGNQVWTSPQFTCGTTNNEGYVTTFPQSGGLTPGVKYTVDQLDVPWDPSKGDCSIGNGQPYKVIWYYWFVCPKNPS